jgi:predicted MFS family arabinose efflux permease
MVVTPLYARNVMDSFVPIFSVIVGDLIGLVGVLIGTYAGLHNVAAPCIQAFILDFALQTTSIANRSSIYAVEPKARNRVNTAFMVFTFLGQITGTAAGNSLYAQHGWIASGSLSVALLCLALVFCFVRGPWETGWIGWHGGWSLKKKDKMSADGHTAEKAHHTVPAEQELANKGRDV